MRTAIALMTLIVLAVLPGVVHAQQERRAPSMALIEPMPTPVPDTNAKPKSQKSVHEHTRSSRHAAKPAHKEKSKVKLRKGGAVPRFTFQQRAQQSFDPLSLTLAPDTRLDTSGTKYNRATGSFVPTNRGQLAAMPSDPNDSVTSAGITNMGQGRNHTVVVPLFQLLDKLSAQPEPLPLPPPPGE